MHGSSQLGFRLGNHIYPYRKTIASSEVRKKIPQVARSWLEGSIVPPLPGYNGFRRKAALDRPAKKFQKADRRNLLPHRSSVPCRPRKMSPGHRLDMRPPDPDCASNSVQTL